MKIFVALSLACALAGCSEFWVPQPGNLTGSKPVTEEPAAAATPSPVTDTQSSHKVSSTSRTRHQSRHQVQLPQEEEGSQPLQMTVVPQEDIDGASPSISMVGDDESRNKAQRTLDVTRKKLKRIDRTRLTGSALAMYDQASGLLIQGTEALGEKDYVAASGFADKASVLADKLKPLQPPR